MVRRLLNQSSVDSLVIINNHNMEMLKRLYSAARLLGYKSSISNMANALLSESLYNYIKIEVIKDE